jgi:hypothetical protein
MSNQWVDNETGKVVLTVIHLWPNDSGECCMCEEMKRLDHAVAWYCGPTHDEIGSVSTEYRGCDGKPAIVGGMRCCKECHDKHYALAHDGNELG